MDNHINLLVITLAVASIALTPMVINQNANAASHYCSDQTGKSNAWIEGCKQGWYDHDHCLSYNPGTGEVAKGYKVGWSKGSC
ncbi:MAG TPA: hypothetical protein VD815_05415 [Candidatus Saccharimonadales bacterium]|nr:hypothetical protein [Candidatus Saccharimonadales bacterium]